MPWAASCSPSHCEFVSGIWPSNSSVPTATISTRTQTDFLAFGVVLPAGIKGQDHRDPDDRDADPGVVRSQRYDTEGDGPVLRERLPFRELARRNRDPSACGTGAKGAHPDLAKRDDHGGNDEALEAVRPRENQGVERSEDDDLVRQGVEELSLIHISEPTRQAEISYAVFCL